MKSGSRFLSRPGIGFCSVDLKGTFREELPWHDPLEARILYAGQGKDKGLWISFDLVQPSRKITDYLRKVLSERLSIDPGNIATHATHTHTSPFDSSFEAAGLELLSNRLVNASKKAMESAEECEIAYIEAKPSHLK